jgi:hypothetical protein
VGATRWPRLFIGRLVASVNSQRAFRKQQGSRRPAGGSSADGVGGCAAPRGPPGRSSRLPGPSVREPQIRPVLGEASARASGRIAAKRSHDLTLPPWRFLDTVDLAG